MTEVVAEYKLADQHQESYMCKEYDVVLCDVMLPSSAIAFNLSVLKRLYSGTNSIRT